MSFLMYLRDQFHFIPVHDHADRRKHPPTRRTSTAAQPRPLRRGRTLKDAEIAVARFRASRASQEHLGGDSLPRRGLARADCGHRSHREGRGRETWAFGIGQRRGG
jgi:hypothetical protein